MRARKNRPEGRVENGGSELMEPGLLRRARPRHIQYTDGVLSHEYEEIGSRAKVARTASRCLIASVAADAAPAAPATPAASPAAGLFH